MENWDNYSEFEQTHYADNEYSYEGHGSLRVENIAKTEATVYEPSKGNSSASEEGRITTQIRVTEDFFGIYLRFIDLDNYYWVGVGSAEIGNDFNDYIVLYRCDRGEVMRVNYVQFSSLSDGSGVGSGARWVPFRITWYIDDLNGFRVWIQEDADRNEEWSTLSGTVVDSDPILDPSDTKTGSGIGFGGNSVWDSSTPEGFWVDNTNIYYTTSN